MKHLVTLVLLYGISYIRLLRKRKGIFRIMRFHLETKSFIISIFPDRPHDLRAKRANLWLFEGRLCDILSVHRGSQCIKCRTPHLYEHYLSLDTFLMIWGHLYLKTLHTFTQFTSTDVWILYRLKTIFTLLIQVAIFLFNCLQAPGDVKALGWK